MTSMGTIYQCCRKGKDVENTPLPVHCEPTQVEAIKWLEENGGGIYRNILHNIQFTVNPHK